MAEEELAELLASSTRFGELLRQYRLAAQLTQGALAERAGLSEHGIQKLESGASHPYRDTAERLTQALRLADQDEALFRIAARPAPRRSPDHAPAAANLGEAARTNLPNPTTSYVARTGELERVTQRLQQSRLLTLTGSGGCGKTRLALEVARQVETEFSDGVWLVELAALNDAALVSQTIATAVRISEEPARPVVDTLIQHLRGRQVLLILDNCEHVIDTCAQTVDALLRSCARVQVLATSREVLGVDGEATWRVTSLSIVDLQGPAATSRELSEMVLSSESGQLFVDRAQLVLPSFAITPQNAPAVAQVCQRLEGIPLAIELGAARLSVLSVEQIAARLDQRFRVLTGGNRTAVRRQQTLHATIDWSYQLLAENERSLFRRLAVFSGGWSLEAAEALATDPSLAREDVFELLSRLVAKSMVLVEPREREPRVVRYRYLETIREYAEQKLVEAGEADVVRTRHRDWYLSFAEQALEGMEGGDQRRWWDDLDLEHDNLRAAMTWSAVDARDPQALLALAGLLGRFWQGARTSHAAEGIGWLEMALAQSETTPSSARARAVHWLGQLAAWTGNMERACPYLEESIAVAAAIGDRRLLSMGLRHLSIALRVMGDLPRALSLIEEAVAVSREDACQREIAFNLDTLAMVLLKTGDHEAAEPLLLESIAVGKKSGDVTALVHAMETLARVYWMRGDHEHARRTLDAALALADQFDLRGRKTSLLLTGGDLASTERDWKGAKDSYAQALSEVSLLTNRALTAHALRHYAAMCAMNWNLRGAVRILGATRSSAN